MPSGSCTLRCLIFCLPHVSHSSGLLVAHTELFRIVGVDVARKTPHLSGCVGARHYNNGGQCLSAQRTAVGTHARGVYDSHVHSMAVSQSISVTCTAVSAHACRAGATTACVHAMGACQIQLAATKQQPTVAWATERDDQSAVG